MTDHIDATVYLQVEPVYSGWAQRSRVFDEPASIQGGKVVGYTLNKPAKPKPGTIEVKITLRLPRGVFLPLKPEAVIVIPETLTQPHPIEVEAIDPNEPTEEQQS